MDIPWCGGIAELLGEREKKKRKGKLVCLSTDLCLAQGAFFSRGRSSVQISVWPKGYLSTDAEALASPHWPNTASAISRIRVKLGYKPDRLLDWPLLGYFLKPLLVVVPIWKHHDSNWVGLSRFALLHPVTGSF